MGTSGQKIRRFYYTRYRNSEQQIFASQYENIQLKFISQQGFPFTFSQPLLTKTGTEIYPLFGQTFGPVLPVRAGAYPSCGSRMDRHCMDRRGVQRGETPRLWVSNRGDQHPCWHTILLAKSSVLYLLRPLTLERGCQLGSPQNRRFCGERRSSGVNESCRLRRDE